MFPHASPLMMQSARRRPVARQVFRRIVNDATGGKPLSQQLDVRITNFDHHQTPSPVQSVEQQFGERAGARAEFDHCVAGSELTSVHHRARQG